MIHDFCVPTFTVISQGTRNPLSAYIANDSLGERNVVFDEKYIHITFIYEYIENEEK